MTLTPDIYQRLVMAKLYIDENYHQTIDLTVVARQAMLSRFHFHRLFRQVYQVTPHVYITRKRLDKARQLLAENKPVVEVCARVGFESVGSFTTLFSKVNGFPPTHYRNMAWLKKQEAKAQPKRFIPHCFMEQFKIGEW